MLNGLAFSLLALGVGAWQARDAWRFGARRLAWRWGALALAGLLAALALGAALQRLPGLAAWRAPTGFGPGWECQESVRPAARVCVRP